MNQFNLINFFLLFLLSFPFIISCKKIKEPFLTKLITESNFEWKQTQELKSNDGESEDLFGFSVCVEENIGIVGAFQAEVGNNLNQGKVYVFENNGTNWNEKQILFSSDGKENDQFGTSVSISGNVCVVGSPYSEVGNNSQRGKAYIFENNGAIWNQKQILIASDGNKSDIFGYKVSISGNVLLISSPDAEVGSNFDQGKVYVFENNGTFWNEKQILFSSDGNPQDQFGTSVSISGNVCVVGSPYAEVGSNFDQGKVYVFENNGTFWNQKQILIVSDGKEDDQFGTSVSISGNVFIVGSRYAEVGNNSNQGKVYVFENNGTFWNQKQILTASDGEAYYQFGTSVSISGNLFLIGSPWATFGNESAEGKAYVFENDGTFWNEKQILTANDGISFDHFGDCVSISGNVSFVGVPDSDVGNHTSQGKVYVFEIYKIDFPKNSSNSNSKTIIIVFSVLIPVFVIFIIVFGFYFLKKKRKKDHSEKEEEILMKETLLMNEK